MSGAWRYYKPALRATVDVQLQTAFSDGNWSTVIRLADQRFRSLKDPYYEAIKQCAQSQLDTITDLYGVLVTIQNLVQAKTVVEADTLDLYEWAILDIKPFSPEQYAATLGALRVRYAKANPKHPAALQGLELCIGRWDLVSAQQIAAAVDKAFPVPKDRRPMFYNIVLTYLLSTSTQVPDSNKKLFGMLALKQLQRAAEVTETSEAGDTKVRGLLSEEEVYLYYRVLVQTQAKDELLKLAKSPRLGAVAQLKQDRAVIFSDTISALQSWGQWDAVYDICCQALESSEEDVTPTVLASNWQFWKTLIRAAGRASNPESARTHVESALAKFLSSDLALNALQRKTMDLVTLEVVMSSPARPLPTSPDAPLPANVAQIVRYLARQGFHPSTFDDVRVYLDLLLLEEVKALLDTAFPKIKEETKDKEAVSFRVLELKIRYFYTTSPVTLSPRQASAEMPNDKYQCQICSALTSNPCRTCLNKLALSAVKTYQDLANQKNYRQDVAIVLATVLLKLAGISQRASQTQPSLQLVQRPLFLQGVLLLDYHLQENAGDIGVRLLLCQLYLLLGCATLAYQVWEPLEIKRTIQDSLSPLFFDRISSLSPGLFQGSRPLLEPLRSYYSKILINDGLVKIWDAFISGSWSSVLSMVNYSSALRRSCTVAMTAVEGRRATRALGGKLEKDIMADPLLRSINNLSTLCNATDYSALPSLESSHAAPLQSLVRFGPELSSNRCHLALLGEQFLDLVTVKPPKEFKPAKANEAAARYAVYLAQTLTDIQHHLSQTYDKTRTVELTANEQVYYNMLSQLASLLLVALPDSDTPAETIASLASSVRLSLADLQVDTQACIDDPFQAFTSMHAVSTFRDAALAVKYVATFGLDHHEREMARDRKGKSGLAKAAVAEMKALDAVAAKALAVAKGWVKASKDRLGEGGWLDRMMEWTFEGDNELEEAVEGLVEGRGTVEAWASRVVESWQAGMKGWTMVDWE